MKTKITTVFSGIVAISLAFGSASCADQLDMSNPDQFDAAGFWNKESDFTGNITAIMNQWRGNYDAMVLMNAGELRTDYYLNVSEGPDGTGLRQLEYINNQLDAGHTQFSNYAQLYGLISNCNTFLYYDGERGEQYINPQLRSYMQGMIYGMRAWANFQIHKMWGTGPIRDKADVILGDYNDVTLRKSQANPEDFLQNIKDDLGRSLAAFEAAGNVDKGIFGAYNGTVYWGKAATEVLAGEVYLWSGKVSTIGSTGEGHTANPADVATAKQYFLNVVNNYGLRLMPSYQEAINNNDNNTERIFATFYSITEANTNWYNYMMYDQIVGGSIDNYWSCFEDDGLTPSPNASRFTYCYVPGADNVSATGARTLFQEQRMQGQAQYQCRNAVYYQYDDLDIRKRIFLPIYRVLEEENDPENVIRNIADFDKEAHGLAGCYVFKYQGQVNTGTNRRVGSTFNTYYRLPLIYAYLAEIANYEDNNGDVEKYINLIRERAFGGLLEKKDDADYAYGDVRNSWDPDVYGYKAGSFAENEVAILQEKTREFFQEGQRWWDLRRLTKVKNGAESDHLIFQPEGCIGYGLDLAAHPTWFEVAPNEYALDHNPISTNTPVLDYATKKHMVLWPLDATLLGNDNSLKQTPGYITAEQKAEEAKKPEDERLTEW